MFIPLPDNISKSTQEGEIVRWSTDGSLFVVQSQATADIYSTVRTIFVMYFFHCLHVTFARI